MCDLHQLEEENYVSEPVLQVEISKEALLEAKGMYKFYKLQKEKENFKELNSTALFPLRTSHL